MCFPFGRKTKRHERPVKIKQYQKQRFGQTFQSQRTLFAASAQAPHKEKIKPSSVQQFASTRVKLREIIIRQPSPTPKPEKTGGGDLCLQNIPRQRQGVSDELTKWKQ